MWYHLHTLYKVYYVLYNEVSHKKDRYKIYHILLKKGHTRRGNKVRKMKTIFMCPPSLDSSVNDTIF